jgi:hypothetical protein
MHLYQKRGWVFASLTSYCRSRSHGNNSSRLTLPFMSYGFTVLNVSWCAGKYRWWLSAISTEDGQVTFAKSVWTLSGIGKQLLLGMSLDHLQGEQYSTSQTVVSESYVPCWHKDYSYFDRHYLGRYYLQHRRWSNIFYPFLVKYCCPSIRRWTAPGTCSLLNRYWKAPLNPPL